MKKFKLIGITKYAERHLDVYDCDTITQMIGCEVVESEWNSHLDDKMMLEMPDGERTHIDFLQLEEVQAELKLE